MRPAAAALLQGPPLAGPNLQPRRLYSATQRPDWASGELSLHQYSNSSALTILSVSVHDVYRAVLPRLLINTCSKVSISRLPNLTKRSVFV
jgi:hypothetical protein